MHKTCCRWRWDVYLLRPEDCTVGCYTVHPNLYVRIVVQMAVGYVPSAVSRSRSTAENEVKLEKCTPRHQLPHQQLPRHQLLKASMPCHVLTCSIGSSHHYGIWDISITCTFCYFGSVHPDRSKKRSSFIVVHQNHCCGASCHMIHDLPWPGLNVGWT